MAQAIVSAVLTAIKSIQTPVVQGVPPIGLSIYDSARFLGVGPETIEYRIRNGDLACVLVGEQRTRMVLIKDLIAFAEARRQPTADEVLKNKKKPKQNRK